MQSVSDDDYRKRLLEQPHFELAATGVFRLGRCYIFWQSIPGLRASMYGGSSCTAHVCCDQYVVLRLTAKGRTNVDLREQVRPGTTQFMTHFRSKTPSKSVGELPDIHAWNRASSPTSAPIVKVVNSSVSMFLLYSSSYHII